MQCVRLPPALRQTGPSEGVTLAPHGAWQTRRSVGRALPSAPFPYYHTPTADWRWGGDGGSAVAHAECLPAPTAGISENTSTFMHLLCDSLLSCFGNLYRFLSPCTGTISAEKIFSFIFIPSSLHYFSHAASKIPDFVKQKSGIHCTLTAVGILGMATQPDVIQ